MKTFYKLDLSGGKEYKAYYYVCESPYGFDYIVCNGGYLYVCWKYKVHGIKKYGEAIYDIQKKQIVLKCLVQK